MDDNYNTIKAKLLKTEKLFEDQEYPAKQSSIFYKQDGSWEEDVEWRRPHEICVDPRFIIEGTSRFDLDQGDVGNCWFISAAAELVTKPVLFGKVVPPNQNFGESYAGIFKFNFWKFGKWKEVIVDDRLPTKKGKLLFCHNREERNEFWSALMEKAYAKVHGSYQALQGGQPHDALVDFTGGIGERVEIKDYEENPTELFKLLLTMFKMNSLICCSTGSTGQGMEVKLKTGLVSTHAYSINNVVEVGPNNALSTDKKTEKLIRILNPWGKKEWNGAWSDGSDEWKTLTAEQKKSLNLTKANEGEFWMCFEDFVDNFKRINICHLSQGIMSTDVVKKEWNVTNHNGQWIEGVSAGGCGNAPNEKKFWMNPQYFVKLTDPDETDDVDTCTLIVSLMQKFRRRMRTQMKTTQYLNLAIGFKIYKFMGKVPDIPDGEHLYSTTLRRKTGTDGYKRDRESSGRFELSPGNYCITPTAFYPGEEADFLLRVVTEKPAKSGEVETPSQPLKPKKAAKAKKPFNKQEDDPISKETCRVLVNFYGSDHKGLLTRKECGHVWQKVKYIQNIFDDFDKDDSGLLSRKELHKAFKNTGFSLSKKTCVYLVTNYCGKEDGLSFDDFVLIYIKIKNLYERIKRDGENGMSFDKWIQFVL